MSVSLPPALRASYYRAKPYLPGWLRMAMRRRYTRSLHEKCRGIWPIDPSAAAVPDGWPGWPEGKRFAFVLTHDVESREGMKRFRALAELEKDLGFRASFNFVPEGEYRVSREDLAFVERLGFEVGVHDLHHDGRLFDNRERFLADARKINHYLREWGASGFRGAFMLRELAWLHSLDITYDASTFDTDPFEPQPEGARTIFPFLVEESGGEYVELPYTLPQDSTLFLLLNEEGPEIWKEKLKWIAERGGMALVNTHPDYLRLHGEERSPGLTYPIEVMSEFLTWVKHEFAEQYWNPLPRELAKWYSGVAVRNARGDEPAPDRVPSRPPVVEESEPRKRLAGRKVAVLLYSFYPADPRPRRAAEALAAEGAEVDLFCLREEGRPTEEEIHGVKVHRLPVGKKRGGKLSYVVQYGKFIWLCFWRLLVTGRREQYDLVHAHNMPDILAFSALPVKWRGGKVVLDLHDPMPELMSTIFGVPEDGLAVRIIEFLERASTSFADLVLTPNEAFRDLFSRRGCPREKIKIVMNTPEERIFDPNKAAPGGHDTDREGDRFRIMHHGFIAERHGLDIALEAIARVREEIPGVEFHVYGGETPFCDVLRKRADELGMTDRLFMHGYQPQEDIARAIAQADLGVIPNRYSSFTDLNFPTRIFEYIAMGTPAIIPSSRGIRDYFGDGEALFFEMDSVESLTAAILDAYRNPAHAGAVTERGGAIHRAHQWSHERENLLTEIERLMPGSAPVGQAAQGERSGEKRAE